MLVTGEDPNFCCPNGALEQTVIAVGSWQTFCGTARKDGEPGSPPTWVALGRKFAAPSYSTFECGR